MKCPVCNLVFQDYIDIDYSHSDLEYLASKIRMQGNFIEHIADHIQQLVLGLKDETK